MSLTFRGRKHPYYSSSVFMMYVKIFLFAISKFLMRRVTIEGSWIFIRLKNLRDWSNLQNLSEPLELEMKEMTATAPMPI